MTLMCCTSWCACLLHMLLLIPIPACWQPYCLFLFQCVSWLASSVLVNLPRYDSVTVIFSFSFFLCCNLVVLLFNWLGNVLLFCGTQPSHIIKLPVVSGSWTHLRGSFHSTLFGDKQWPNAAYLLLMLILCFSRPFWVLQLLVHCEKLNCLVNCGK